MGNKVLHLKKASGLSNEDLVAAIQAGDRASEATLVCRFHGPVRQRLVSLGCDADRAQDLAQETLLTVILRLRGRGIDHPAGLAGFVHQTARFLFLAWKRRSDQRFVSNVENLEDTLESQARIDEHLEQVEQAGEVRQLVNLVPVARDREILERYYFQEQSRALVCDALQLSQVHFSRVICRARTRLRKLLHHSAHRFETLGLRRA